MDYQRRSIAILAAAALAAPSALAAQQASISEFQVVVEKTETHCATALQTNIFERFWPIYLQMIGALNTYVKDHGVNLASPTAAWVIKNSCFSIYRRGNERYIGPKYRIFTGTAGELDEDWREYLRVLEAASQIAENNGAFDAEPDEIRKVLVKMEVFLIRYPAFIRRQELMGMYGHWAAWYIADDRNSQYDEKGHLKATVRKSWESFLEDNPASRIHPVLLAVYNDAKKSGFRRDPLARTDLKPLWAALEKMGYRR